MKCDEWQALICARVDAGPPAGGETDALDRHLAGCASCREFEQVWMDLDRRLAATARSTALPGNFRAGVLARCGPHRPILTPAELAVRRAELEREHEALQRQIGGVLYFLQPAVLLRLMTIAGISAGSGIALALALQALATAAAQVIGPDLALVPVGLGIVILAGLAYQGLRKGLRSLPVP